MARRKKEVKPKAGDVFTFPIHENKYCFGQVITDLPMVNKLYILFDFVSNDAAPDLDIILKQPLLAIAHLDDGSIIDGDWTIIDHADVVLKNIIFPNYLMGLPPVVISYEDKVLRPATEEDISELTYRRSYTSNIFDGLAKAKFADREWEDIYDQILFHKHQWVSSEGRVSEMSRSHHEIHEIENIEDDLIQITVRYKLNRSGFGTPDDLTLRYEIEDILDESLRLSDNGDCDGGEIGNGEMLIFCYVKDPKKAMSTITEALRNNGFLEGANISY